MVVLIAQGERDQRCAVPSSLDLCLFLELSATGFSALDGLLDLPGGHLTVSLDGCWTMANG